MIKPDCRYGYSLEHLKESLSEDTFKRLSEYLAGQTLAMCDGFEYSYDNKNYEFTECGPHGSVVYYHDLLRFLEGKPVID